MGKPKVNKSLTPAQAALEASSVASSVDLEKQILEVFVNNPLLSESWDQQRELSMLDDLVSKMPLKHPFNAMSMTDLVLICYRCLRRMLKDVNFDLDSSKASRPIDSDKENGTAAKSFNGKNDNGKSAAAFPSVLTCFSADAPTLSATTLLCRAISPHVSAMLESSYPSLPTALPMTFRIDYIMSLSFVTRLLSRNTATETVNTTDNTEASSSKHQTMTILPLSAFAFFSSSLLFLSQLTDSQHICQCLRNSICDGDAVGKNCMMSSQCEPKLFECLTFVMQTAAKIASATAVNATATAITSNLDSNKQHPVTITISSAIDCASLVITGPHIADIISTAPRKCDSSNDGAIKQSRSYVGNDSVRDSAIGRLLSYCCDCAHVVAVAVFRAGLTQLHTQAEALRHSALQLQLQYGLNCRRWADQALRDLQKVAHSELKKEKSNGSKDTISELSALLDPLSTTITNLKCPPPDLMSATGLMYILHEAYEVIVAVSVSDSTVIQTHLKIISQISLLLQWVQSGQQQSEKTQRLKAELMFAECLSIIIEIDSGASSQKASTCIMVLDRLHNWAGSVAVTNFDEVLPNELLSRLSLVAADLEASIITNLAATGTDSNSNDGIIASYTGTQCAFAQLFCLLTSGEELTHPLPRWLSLALFRVARAVQAAFKSLCGSTNSPLSLEKSAITFAISTRALPVVATVIQYAASMSLGRSGTAWNFQLMVNLHSMVQQACRVVCLCSSANLANSSLGLLSSEKLRVSHLSADAYSGPQSQKTSDLLSHWSDVALSFTQLCKELVHKIEDIKEKKGVVSNENWSSGNMGEMCMTLQIVWGALIRVFATSHGSITIDVVVAEGASSWLLLASYCIWDTTKSLTAQSSKNTSTTASVDSIVRFIARTAALVSWTASSSNSNSCSSAHRTLTTVLTGLQSHPVVGEHLNQAITEEIYTRVLSSRMHSCEESKWNIVDFNDSISAPESSRCHERRNRVLRLELCVEKELARECERQCSHVGSNCEDLNQMPLWKELMIRVRLLQMELESVGSDAEYNREYEAVQVRLLVLQAMCARKERKLNDEGEDNYLRGDQRDAQIGMSGESALSTVAFQGQSQLTSQAVQHLVKWATSFSANDSFGNATSPKSDGACSLLRAVTGLVRLIWANGLDRRELMRLVQSLESFAGRLRQCVYSVSAGWAALWTELLCSVKLGLRVQTALSGVPTELLEKLDYSDMGASEGYNLANGIIDNIEKEITAAMEPNFSTTSLTSSRIKTDDDGCTGFPHKWTRNVDEAVTAIKRSTSAAIAAFTGCPGFNVTLSVSVARFVGAAASAWLHVFAGWAQLLLGANVYCAKVHMETAFGFCGASEEASGCKCLRLDVIRVEACVLNAHLSDWVGNGLTMRRWVGEALAIIDVKNATELSVSDIHMCVRVRVMLRCLPLLFRVGSGRVLTVIDLLRAELADFNLFRNDDSSNESVEYSAAKSALENFAEIAQCDSLNKAFESNSNAFRYSLLGLLPSLAPRVIQSNVRKISICQSNAMASLVSLPFDHLRSVRRRASIDPKCFLSFDSTSPHSKQSLAPYSPLLRYVCGAASIGTSVELDCLLPPSRLQEQISSGTCRNDAVSSQSLISMLQAGCAGDLANLIAIETALKRVVSGNNNGDSNESGAGAGAVLFLCLQGSDSANFLDDTDMLLLGRYSPCAPGVVAAVPRVIETRALLRDWAQVQSDCQRQLAADDVDDLKSVDTWDKDETKKRWWTRRKEIDERISELLQRFEEEVLGPWSCILVDESRMDELQKLPIIRENVDKAARELLRNHSSNIHSDNDIDEYDTAVAYFKPWIYLSLAQTLDCLDAGETRTGRKCVYTVDHAVQCVYSALIQTKRYTNVGFSDERCLDKVNKLMNELIEMVGHRSPGPARWENDSISSLTSDFAKVTTSPIVEGLSFQENIITTEELTISLSKMKVLELRQKMVQERVVVPATAKLTKAAMVAILVEHSTKQSRMRNPVCNNMEAISSNKANRTMLSSRTHIQPSSSIIGSRGALRRIRTATAQKSQKEIGSGSDMVEPLFPSLSEMNLRRGSAGRVILLLDETLQTLPLESGCSLAFRPCTRLPGLAMLLKLVNRRDEENEVKKLESGAELSTVSCAVRPDRAWFCLDPDGSLPGTAVVMGKALEPYVGRWGWTGYVSRSPTLEQVVELHAAKNMFVYSGHGAGEGMLSAAGRGEGSGLHRLRHIRCPETCFLWGCSSGRLVAGFADGGIIVNSSSSSSSSKSNSGVRRGASIYDPDGAALAYLMSGSSLVAGALWDVTDRDLDRLSSAHVSMLLGDGKSMQAVTGITAAEALCTARRQCKLRHAVGSACVLYGL